MPSNHKYNKHLQKYAHENRMEMTKAEACLWKYALSKKRMLGYQFRRQRLIEKFIVDFICLPLKFIIEVDGYSHQLAENQEKDRKRRDALEELGYTVLRFKDEEVLKNMPRVRDVIQRWIENLEEIQKPSC